MPKPKNILVLYKNSTYASYFLSHHRRYAQLQGLFNSEEIKKFRKTHETHFWTLAYVEAVLKAKKLRYTKVCRGTNIDYSRYDLIITVGGDGTFLEAARQVTNQWIWGVNSDPAWSVGRFCSGHARNFESILESILKNKPPLKCFNRLKLVFNNNPQMFHVLNDVLVCHDNPAAMNRYYLILGRLKEEQRSSGVWIATAAGSSGAIRSAGGKLLPQESKSFQYKPRELYIGKGTHYRLKGGVLKPNQTMTVASLIREGVIFMDGSHVCLPFSFGTTIKIGRSPYPLKVVWP